MGKDCMFMCGSIMFMDESGVMVENMLIWCSWKLAEQISCIKSYENHDGSLRLWGGRIIHDDHMMMLFDILWNNDV